MTMGRMVGIDLGTTNTVVAIMIGPRPEVLDSREGRSQIRSVVSIKQRKGKQSESVSAAEMLVGDSAESNWQLAPHDTIVSIKRLMGRGVSDPEVQRVRKNVSYQIVEPIDGTKDSVRVIIGGQQLSPVDISAKILLKAKEDGEYRLGEPVTHAVITVPAYFSQIQRDATRKAGIQAGLKVMKIIDEPTAAAIAFGMETQSAEPRTMLVYDLGGGTFDVSLLMLASNVYAPLNLEGDMWLGGDDLDQVIIDHVLKWVQKEYGVNPHSDHRFMVSLRKAAQTVKERLSGANSADLILTAMIRDSEGNLLDVDMEITRDEFERMIAPLVGHYRECKSGGCATVNLLRDTHCIKCGGSLNGSVRRGKTLQIVDKALENAKLAKDDIDYIVMAGNSTMVPYVQQTMEMEFGAEKIMRTVHPKHSVAMGAAIAAAWLKFNLVCQAPDPVDPKKECGHVNDPDAKACAKCGADLSLAEQVGGQTDTNQNGEEPEWGVGQIGGIAPFKYGTQGAGDTYHVFIEKGETFPTDAPKPQTFYTRFPNQRIISIPVYGGDNLAKASLNEKQGQAFALLPPSLPKDTPVRLQLTLDSNGIFEIGAWLEDGTDLHPWNGKGEADEKAMTKLEALNQRLADKSDTLSPEAVALAESGRDRVFDHMRKKDFVNANHELEDIERKMEDAGKEGEVVDLKRIAENLTGYAAYILREYAWAIGDSRQIYRLTKLVEETREALESGNHAKLKENADLLENAINGIPEIVQALMGMKSAILSRIQPTDPVQAARLLEEISEIESSIKRGDYQGMSKIEGFIKKLTKAIEEIGARNPSNKVKCSSCGFENSSGQRYCSQCGEDLWILGGHGPSTGQFSR